MDKSLTYGEVGGRRLRRCGTMDEHWRLVRKDPEYRWRRLQIERDVQDWIRRYGEPGSEPG